MARAETSSGYSQASQAGPAERGTWHRRAVDRVRGIGKPELVAACGLMAWTAVRTVAVKNGFDQPDDRVDWRVFAGIELATTPHYVWATGQTVRSLIQPAAFSFKDRLTANGTFAATFLAPYAYVAALGGEAAITRPDVAVPIGVFATISAASAGAKVVSGRRRSENASVESQLDSESSDGTALPSESEV